jgi:hypothetical protein
MIRLTSEELAELLLDFGRELASPDNEGPADRPRFGFGVSAYPAAIRAP